MKIIMNGHDFAYEMENVGRMFTTDIEVAKGTPENLESDCAYLYQTENCECSELGVKINYLGQQKESKVAVSNKATDKERERILAVLLFELLCDITKTTPPWGIITGIRPAKYVAGMLETMQPEKVIAELESDYKVSEPKAKLAILTAQNGKRIADTNTEKSYSLYVSIPFCPTRCSYCSFVAKSVERDKVLVEPYLDKLCEELAYCAKSAQTLGLKLESVYIGGGTPTVLSAPQLKKLTDTISLHFPLSEAREYSVEAGRPDTITPEKLAVLKKANVTRLSINPQTANASVLEAIGRKHTAKDIEQSFQWAREAGFDNINADLIAGLPLDTMESFRNSMEWLLGLQPENITVHALTLKRASNMTENKASASQDAAEMVDYSFEKLCKEGYEPYYMYKQKGTVDSLENTGYAKKNKECYYNAYIMDELHTIIACGAGAVTKLKNQKSGLITRIFNYKYPKEYIDGFDVILKRKEGIAAFYES